MASIQLIRYITDQDTSKYIGNNTCYSKPQLSLVYDSNGSKGDYGYIMKLCPPSYDVEYEQVYLKYEENFDYVTGGEITLNHIALQDGDKVWLSNQSDDTENGIYYVRSGQWDFYKTVDDTVFIDLGARAYDTVDGDISRNVITDQNINFGEVGFYTISYYVLNSQGILSTLKRKVKIIECSASIVPTNSFKITDYLIKAEADSSVLDPEDLLDSCDGCAIDGGSISDPSTSTNQSSSLGNNVAYIRSDGSVVFINNQSMGGNRLIELADPIDGTDAVNLQTLEEYIRDAESIGRTYTTGEAINIYTVVIMETDGFVYNVDSSNLSHMDKVIGIAIDTQAIASTIPVITSGLIDGFSGLSVGYEYFFDNSGNLTTTPPISGFTQVVGIAVEPTVLLIDLKTPIGI